MHRIQILSLLITIMLIASCRNGESTHEILNKTIQSIEKIESIYYKQDMYRTNPRLVDDTIFRYREMYFIRLIQDSIVGVKGHWYFYSDDKKNIKYEDIYDGNRLIRKNNLDSVIRLYDIAKYPSLKETHFWSHNTLYGMQYEFKYMLNHLDSYTIEKLNDTTIMGKACFQILIHLEGKSTMPGFATKLEDSEGSISTTLYLIEKENYYPIRMKGEFYSKDSPEQKIFIEQSYYDIEFNLSIDESVQFNTSDESFIGFKVNEIKPE